MNMMNWIQHPVILEGERVKLVPLDAAHFAALAKIALNPEIWEFISVKSDTEEKALNFLRSAVLKRPTGEQYPFAVIDKVTDRVIGHTMFHNIYAGHRKLEIGWTWYHPAYWRTGYNRECKLLLFTYAFETLKAIRVQLQTDELNLRSRTAIEGIGGKFEGIIRNDRIRDTGTFRNTAMYSVIESEWPEVKQMLTENLKQGSK